MAERDTAAVARKFHEAWNERDPEGGAAVIAMASARGVTAAAPLC